MTWGDFKRQVEERGVGDGDVVVEVAVAGDQAAALTSVELESGLGWRIRGGN
jgi:hypothetical protein